MNKPASTEELLAARGKTHGEYAEHARCTQTIMRALENERNWDKLPDIIRETCHMIAHKLARIVTGNPYVKDHYDDIAGYSKLVSQRLEDGVGVVTYIYIEEKEPEPRGPGTPEDGGHHEKDNQSIEAMKGLSAIGRNTLGYNINSVLGKDVDSLGLEELYRVMTHWHKNVMKDPGSKDSTKAALFLRNLENRARILEERTGIHGLRLELLQQAYDYWKLVSVPRANSMFDELQRRKRIPLPDENYRG